MEMERHARDRGDAGSPKTIGDVLYADEPSPTMLEAAWTGLVRRVAAGDASALYTLYQWTHRIAFTLALRQLKKREAAAEVTLHVFQNVWRRAYEHDGGDASVVGWIANLTRQRTIDMLRLVPEARHSSFVPDADLSQSTGTLGGRLCWWLGLETGRTFTMPARDEGQWAWREVAPGISCQLLSTDRENHRVSLLVRLAPGTDYPPHRHAGLEELHLLNGELTINDRKLFPGDYNRAEAGSVDRLVRSETGCTCLLMTSTRDEIEQGR
jgi:quercetin dioxygenase-like cupin family protein